MAKQAPQGFPQSVFAELLATISGLQQDAPSHTEVLSVLKDLSSSNGISDDVDTQAIAKLLSTLPLKNWNADLSVRFLELRKRKDAPAATLLQLVLTACNSVELVQSHPIMKPLLMAVALGGVSSPLPFHSHHHTREVVCLASIIGVMQNRLTPFDDAPTALAEVLIAACIHDFAHDGQGNRRYDKHTPMRLERRSLDQSEMYLKAAGLADASWSRIRVMVLATDVSKDGPSAVSPAEWLRRAYAQHSDTTGCPDDLMPLFKDRVLLKQTGILEDSDLGTSAGMPYEHARRMTALIAEETKVLSPTPQTLIGFIDHICRGTYITTAAQQLFGDNMQVLRRKAEQENADTIYYWS